MRILICDDDTFITQQLHTYITEFFSDKNLKVPDIHIFCDGESLLQDCGEKDIVFLDVEMPGINGISTGNTLKEQNQNAIIFIVTSHTEYLDDAMRFHVFRYLSKPIDRTRLFVNLRDAIQLYNSYEAKILIEEKNENHVVMSSDIVSVEADKHKAIIHTVEGDYFSIYSIQHWIKQLDQRTFFQCNRSFIVNMHHVSDFNHSQIHLYHGKYTATLTGRKYNFFKNAYLIYLESTR